MGGGLLSALFVDDEGGSLDMVSVLVLTWPGGFPVEEYRQLTGELPPSLPNGRIPLYVCPECGDLGCGAVTARIEWTAETVTWSDFGFQNDFEEFTPGDVLRDVEPIVFDRQRYLDVLADCVGLWSTIERSGPLPERSRRFRFLRRRR